MATDYYRIELDYCLDIDEVAELMIDASGGWMNSFQPRKSRVGTKQYSTHNWKGQVMMPGTAPGPGSQVLIGITDYYFNRSRKQFSRRGGHRHFFAKGSHSAVRRVVDIFKAAIPSTLWCDEEIEDSRRGWPQVQAGTIIPKVTVETAQTYARLLEE